MKNFQDLIILAILQIRSALQIREICGKAGLFFNRVETSPNVQNSRKLNQTSFLLER